MKLTVDHREASLPIVLQPPIVTLLVVLSAWLTHSLLGPWQSIIHVPVLGGALVALGFSCMLWARILFTSRHTTLFVGRRSSQLVCDGPFRLSRNPMYVGVMAFLVGLALWVGTWPFYMAVPVVFLFLNFFHIPREERMLRDVFGERYLTYSPKVRRLFTAPVEIESWRCITTGLACRSLGRERYTQTLENDGLRAISTNVDEGANHYL